MKTIAVPQFIGTAHSYAPEGCVGTIEKRPIFQVDLDRVLAFQFDPLVHRMVDKYGWTEDDARRCFEDTKKYLYLCVTSPLPVVPPPKIDDMWHNFILFTMDYEEFCHTKLGRFVHHRPRRRGESLTGKTLNAASVALSRFGVISENWGKPEHAGGNEDCGTCMNCAPCHNCSNT